MREDLVGAYPYQHNSPVSTRSRLVLQGVSCFDAECETRQLPLRKLKLTRPVMPRQNPRQPLIYEGSRWMTRRNEAEGRGSVRGGGSEEMMSERASERGECGRERVRGECGSERVTRKGGWFQGWKRGRERRNGYRRRQRQTLSGADVLP